MIQEVTGTRFVRDDEDQDPSDKAEHRRSDGRYMYDVEVWSSATVGVEMRMDVATTSASTTQRGRICASGAGLTTNPSVAQCAQAGTRTVATSNMEENVKY